MLFNTKNLFDFLFFNTLIIDLINVTDKKACYDLAHKVQKATFDHNYGLKQGKALDGTKYKHIRHIT